MSRPSEATPGPSVGDVLLAVRELLLPIAAFVVVAALAAYAVGTTLDPRHEASATVVVSDARAQVGVFGAPVPGVGTDRDEIAVLARGDAVRLRVAQALDRPTESVPEVIVEVDDRDPSSVTLTVAAPTASSAVDLANGWARAVVEERRSQVAGQLAGIVETLADAVARREAAVARLRAEQATAAAAPTDPSAAALAAQLAAELQAETVALDRLRGRLVELQVEAAAAAPGVRLADPAATASVVGAPAPWHLAVLAVLIAVVLATTVVYVRLSYLTARSSGTSRFEPRVLADGPPSGSTEAAS